MEIFEDEGRGELSSFEKFKLANGGVLGHIHIMRDRTQIPIYMMDDSHLLNTIGLFSKRVEDASQAHAHKVTMLDVVMEKKAPGQKAVERLRDLISDGYPLIGRYILEANRRGLFVQASEKAMPFYGVVSDLLGTDATGGRLGITDASATAVDRDDDFPGVEPSSDDME